MSGEDGLGHDLPPAVRELIHEHIDSIEQLEVLLLVQRRPDRDWTPAEVSEELRTNVESTGTRMRDLADRGLFAPLGRSDAYRYAPRSSQLADAVAELAREYAVRRVSVTTLIFSKPLDRIRSFADAFRFRRGRDG